MFKIFTIIYFTIIAIMIVAFIYDYQPLIIGGYSFIMPSLCIFYGIIRKWRTTKVDRVMYCLFVVGVLSDVVVYLDFGTWSVAAQIFLTLGTYILYCRIFRKEGTYVVYHNKTDQPKFIIPFLIIFFFFGIELFTVKDDNLYFAGMIYAISEYIFILYAILRPVNSKSYLWVFIGVTFKILCDASYTMLFIKNVENPIIYYIHFVVYSISQFSIIMGILSSNAKELENKGNLSIEIPELLGSKYILDNNSEHNIAISKNRSIKLAFGKWQLSFNSHKYHDFINSLRLLND